MGAGLGGGCRSVARMRKVFVIGIGAGDPDYVTMQAVKALNQVDVFFVIDKGAVKDDLTRLRREICERYVENDSYRVVEAPEVERDRSATAYTAAVVDWHGRRAEVYERLIRDELRDDETGAFLVWGDPAFYDSTLRIIDLIVARDVVAFDYEVIPGISSFQALAAKHRVILNRVGGPITVTTGRRLAAGGMPDGVDDVVVMLDGPGAFVALAEDPAAAEVDLYWGAYVGTKDELLVSGRLPDVADDVQRTRADARERKGWIMDTYYLRRRPADAS